MKLKNNMKSSEEDSSVLKSKCIDIGQGNIDKVELTNVDSVKQSISCYEAAARALQAYKQQLDEDAVHIEELGLVFDEIDHEIASFMK